MSNDSHARDVLGQFQGLDEVVGHEDLLLKVKHDGGEILLTLRDPNRPVEVRIDSLYVESGKMLDGQRYF